MYFEPYASRILRIHDCSVWYEAEPEAPFDREDLALSLSLMQLFVVPVTARLLMEPCRAMDFELPLAREKHIPILPLMMEEGLDSLFSDRFGDFQYMDPFDRDPTRRPFEEVLSSYIRTVLVGDALADRIRSAFDAYIFLSYRKKDRRKAQELMRLIHKDPLARDIAIWYDEFLTPGEDFNEAIGQMLARSDLFALVVTPSLVNEPNYVMDIEYPEALRLGKPVFPVEMEETDRAALEENYASIPACVPGMEGEAFLEALKERLKGLALSAREDSPAHTYLIGLAYLDGIDVEIDRDRAAGLITGAAKAGIPEAMLQLANMYAAGKGVPVDHEQEIRWRKAYIGTLRASYEEDGGREKAFLLMHGLLGLGDLQMGLAGFRDPEGARETFEELRDLAEEWAGKGSASAREHLLESFERLGSLALDEGDMAGAEAFFEKELDLCTEMDRETGTERKRRYYAARMRMRGSKAASEGDLKRAELYFDKALLASEELAWQKADPKELRILASQYELLGFLALGQGGPAAAETLYKKGLALLEDLAGDPEIRKDLPLRYERLADMALKRNDPAAARSLYEKSLAIREEMPAETGTSQARRDLSRIRRKLGVLALDRKDFSLARSHLVMSLVIARDLAGVTGAERDCLDQVRTLRRLARLALEEKDLTAARAWYEQAMAVSEDLAGREPSAAAVRNLADLSLSYGIFLYNRCREKAKARTLFERVRDLGKGNGDQRLAALHARAEEILAKHF